MGKGINLARGDAPIHAAVLRRRPIIFSGPMVRAILEDRKTQTRRICTGQTELSNIHDFPLDRCPYGQSGNQLWVRETWRKVGSLMQSDNKMPGESTNKNVIYKTDAVWDGPWRPSIFMPQWASRIMLEITQIRVERLQKITLGDVFQEGVIEWANRAGCKHGFSLANDEKLCVIWAFQHFWNLINAKRGFGWDKNPWVWVIKFKRVV